MKDDTATTRYEARDQPNILSLSCLGKKNTIKWYRNSHSSFPFSNSQTLIINVTLYTSGIYFCYGYDENKSRYFLSGTRVQAFGR